MNHFHTRYVYPSNQPAVQASEITISELVGQVYQDAPAAVRTRLVEQLIRPLGVLALLAVANGIFAKAWFHSAWPGTQVRLEDVNKVRAVDIVSLVDRVQQVGVETLDGLAQVLASSSTLAGSAAAVILATILLRRSGAGRNMSFATCPVRICNTATSDATHDGVWTSSPDSTQQPGTCS